MESKSFFSSEGLDTVTLVLPLSLDGYAPLFPFKLSMFFTTLRASWKSSSRVAFSSFLTNITMDMGKIEVYNTMETSSVG